MIIEETVVANQALLAAHAEKIKQLQERQTEIKHLALSTKELAISMGKLTEQLSNVDRRLLDMEDNNRHKALTIWACIVTGVVGAAIGYMMMGVFA